MTKQYTVTCPACDAEFDIEAEPLELADETGCYSDCPECKETEIEFDYDPETDTLTPTPGQYAEEETCDVCGEPIDDCACPDDEEDEDAEN